jgi:hypothetical protein
VPDIIGLFLPTFDSFNIASSLSKNRHEEIHLQASRMKIICKDVNARIIVENKSMKFHFGFLSGSGFFTG